MYYEQVTSMITSISVSQNAYQQQRSTGEGKKRSGLLYVNRQK